MKIQGIKGYTKERVLIIGEGNSVVYQKLCPK